MNTAVVKNVSVNALKAHIDRMNRGHLDFSEVEMNCRADLVRFEGYTVEQAATMDEGEVYSVLDSLEGCGEQDDWEPNHYGFVCGCGSKNIKMQWINGWPGRYGSSDDGYLCRCSCDKEFFVHECAMDAHYEEEPA